MKLCVYCFKRYCSYFLGVRIIVISGKLYMLLLRAALPTAQGTRRAVTSQFFSPALTSLEVNKGKFWFIFRITEWFYGMVVGYERDRICGVTDGFLHKQSRCRPIDFCFILLHVTN